MRTRIYNKCTDAEITDYLNRGGDTLFMSVGVTELHGQLPVDCESILAEAAALLMAEKADGLAVINLPFFHAGATAIGRSTVNISIKAGYDYLKTVVYAFYKLGFKRIFFLSMHGPAYLTINSVCMDFFHETQNPICHLELGHVMDIAKENGWVCGEDRMETFTDLMYGAYKVMNQLEFVPILSDFDREAFLAKRKEGNVKQGFKKDLHKLNFSTGGFGSYYAELEEHGGLEYSMTEQEREQRGEKGQKLLQEMVEKFDPLHFSTLLQELDQAVNEEIVPRYPHLNFDKPYK